GVEPRSPSALPVKLRKTVGTPSFISNSGSDQCRPNGAPKTSITYPHELFVGPRFRIKPVHELSTSASRWLKDNNPIFKEYNQTHVLQSMLPEALIPHPLPMARLASTSVGLTTSLINNIHSLVVPNNDFPVEIHNEDYRYQSLMAGFLKTDDNFDLPIQNDNRDIEAMVFPGIFTLGCYHYEDCKRLLEFKQSVDSYGKYIKLQTQLSEQEQDSEPEKRYPQLTSN
ncbi:9532_t:CDS:2, partial [Entrophospora sp. SA101]